MTDRAEAQRRANQIAAFRAELEALRSSGQCPLTADQERDLAAYHDQLLRQLTLRYDIDRTEASGRLSRGMQLLSFFGAVTLTAAVYSLVARFWGGFELPLQATLLVTFPLVSLVGVELSARRERTLYVASLFAIVAYGTFWLAVGELSALLNIPPTPPVIWAGALFGVALALAYGFRLILAASLLALIAAPAATLFSAAGIPWPEIISYPEPMMAVALSLPLLAPRLAPIESGFPAVVRGVGFGSGLLMMLFLSVAGEASLLPPRAEIVEAIYQGGMLVACVSLIVIGLNRGWRETVLVASASLALLLLTRFVDWFWDRVPAYLFFLILAGIAFAWLLVLRRFRARLA